MERLRLIYTTTYFCRLIICYLFSEFHEAAKNANENAKIIDKLAGLMAIPIFIFFESLINLALFHEASRSEQKRILKKVKANQRKMKKWGHP